MKTVEAVTEGQADKVCDQIADAIVDGYLLQDSSSRVHVEVFGSHGALMVGGEVQSKASIDVALLAQRVYKDIGYTDELEVFAAVEKPTDELSQLRDQGLPTDHAVVAGYATAETPEYLPRPLVLARSLTKRLSSLRRNSADFGWLRPDGKVVVGVDRDRVVLVAVSAQHDASVRIEEVREQLTRRLVEPVLGDIAGVEVAINPAGLFIRGGFDADTGLTGRKLAADTYGGIIPFPGGALSGKDPGHVDRLGACMARFAAKNLVANGFAKNCLVQASYVAGRDVPVFVRASGGDGKDLTPVLHQHFDFRLPAIAERLDLRRPVYRQAASYGQFGQDGLPWEEIVIF
jgi:S-adenosylmethionine synthetase